VVSTLSSYVSPSNPPQKPRLGVENLNYEVQRHALLTNVNIALTAGDTLCIVGANGSGKSILLELLAGSREPTSGTITTGGHEVLLLSREALRDSNGLTVCEATRAVTRCDSTCVGHQLFRADIDPNQIVASLSPGELQRVLFAATRCSEARIVLFDDPTAGLDADGFELFLQTVERLAEARRITVIATTSPDVVLELQASAVQSLVDGALHPVRPFPPTIEELVQSSGN